MMRWLFSDDYVISVSSLYYFLSLVYASLLCFRHHAAVTAEIIESFGEISDTIKHNNTKLLLLSIRQKMSSDYPMSSEGRFEYPKCRFGHSGRKDFISHCTENYTGNLPVFVQQLNLNWNQFGNSIGMLFEDISCAQLIGAHFLAIGNIVDHTSTIGHNLPLVIVHQEPAANFSVALERISKECNAGAWPFGWDPSVSNVPLTRGDDNAALVRKVINHAINTPAKEQLPLNFSLHHHSHMYANNASADRIYPIVSDVAIHYRCRDDDNVRFRYMGLMSISYVVSLINKDAKYIYIHTEEKHHHQHRRCKQIVRALFDDVVTTFPRAHIVVFEGGNILHTMYDLVNSRLSTICSSSTFCWHVVIGKTSGDVFIPPIYYPGRSEFSYPQWHYMTVLPIWEWSDETFANVSSMISILRNETLFELYRCDTLLAPCQHKIF